MAENTIFGQFLTCDVCAETFSDAVSLSCNPNFCSHCLPKFWEQAKKKNCPTCESKFSKEYPGENFALKEQADVLAGRQEPESSETEKGKKNPPEMCRKHPELVFLFCKDEQRAVCVCEFSLHQNHKVVPLEQEVGELKEQLRSDLTSLQDKKKKYEHVEETYKDIIQFFKTQLLSTEEQIRAEFNKLHQFLKEEEESRLAALREEEEQKGKTISTEMKMIQEQISFQSLSISAVQEDLQKPSVAFLSSYEAPQIRAGPQHSLSDSQLLSGALIDVAKHLGNLSFRVWEKMKEKVRFSPVILDPNTANHSLHLCEDLTSVRYGDTQQLPDNPERFIKYSSVLGSVGFTSGTHSWVVEVGDHPHWTVGLATESVFRKGEKYLSPGVLCLLHRYGTYALSGGGGYLDWIMSVKRVRVQLDYDRGEVSFYDHDDSRHLYTYGKIFTKKLFPFFTVGSAGDATTAYVKILSNTQ